MRKSIISVFFLSSCVASAQSFVTGQAARAELGQPLNFTTGQSGANNNLLGGASGLAYANGTLWVADSNRVAATPENNRVVGFPTNQIPGPYVDLTQLTPGPGTCGLCGYTASTVLGQPDFQSTNAGRAAVATPANGSTAESGSMTTPTAVATDGTYLAVADTDNNRVLIWNSIPTGINAAPNVVLGQTNFTGFQTQCGANSTPGCQARSATTLLGPQGVWIQNGALFVADTQNYRVLVWKHIPTQNNQPADLVLGQPNFSTANGPTITQSNPYPPTAPNLLLNPTSVTSDGTHLFVADLGNNRVLIWNTAFINGQLSLSNDQGADVAVGQPLLTTSVANWSSALCGASDNTAPCAATLNFPRFALSDGKRLFVADGGNDRVLIYNTIPTQNGASADLVLGQVDFVTDQDTSATISVTSTLVDNTSAVDITPNPTSLAFDGTNLYVADPYNRRILVFTPADTALPEKSVVNWASEIIRQEGIVTFSVPSGGTLTAGDTVTVTIQGTGYTYTLVKNDTVNTIAQGMVNVINNSNSGSGDPNATAIFAGTGTGSIYLASKAINPAYDSITLAASSSDPTNIAATASGSYLAAGNAGTGAAGMLVEIDGSNLSDNTVTAPMNGNNLPITLGGVEVFMDGLASPVLSVSPTQIISEIPFNYTNGSLNGGTTIGNQSISDRNSTSIYVRTVHNNGTTTVTNATPMYIAPANPGIFNAPAYSGQPRPWPVMNAYHQSGNPTAVVSVDGTVTAGNTATITIAGKSYTYTVASSDTLLTVAQNLANLINNAPDPNVTASLGGAFQRVILTARNSGQAGTGIAVSASTNSSATVTLTPYTSSTCCAVVSGSLITNRNPAVPGELINVSATGLGTVQDINGNVLTVATGEPWLGPVVNSAVSSVNATMNGSTAEVITAGLVQNGYGMYDVQMVVPSSLPVNAETQLYIAQNAFISNTVTIPVGQPGVPTPVGGLGTAFAQIVISPAVLVLNAAPGSPTQSQTVVLTNPNSYSVSVSNITITGPNASQFQYTTNCQGSVGQTCNITVTYTPGSAVVAKATLSIHDNVSGSLQTVPLTGVSGAQYVIANKMSARVLDVVGASSSDGAQIQQYDYFGYPNQQWTLIPVGGGNYAIMNLGSGKVLDVPNYSMTGTTLIQQWDYLGTVNQQWTLTSTSTGFYTITNVNSGLVLDDTNLSYTDGTLIQQYQYTGGDNQQWSLLSRDTYRIINNYSGKAVDDTGYSQQDGTLIQQWSYLGSSNQQWQFVPLDNTYFAIKNMYSGKALATVGMSTVDFAHIQQTDFMGTDDQIWALVPGADSGTYAIVNKLSGLVLDNPGYSAINGTLLQQYDWLGGANQEWVITSNQ